MNPTAPLAANRRALKGVTAANGAPTQGDAAKGFSTQGRRWLHLVVKVTGGTTVQWKLWMFDEASQLWCLDTRPGTAGVVTLLTVATDNPQLNIVEIDGASRVYVELNTFGGGESVDVWLSTTSIVEMG